jgi:hypothetical protein
MKPLLTSFSCEKVRFVGKRTFYQADADVNCPNMPRQHVYAISATPEKACAKLLRAATMTVEEYFQPMPNATAETQKSPEAAGSDTYSYNKSHEIATCAKCGREMRYNVPRLGPDGGYVHNDTGKYDCGESGKRGKKAKRGD